jgi:type I restriction enzyme S subunit
VPRLRFPEFQDAGEWEVKTMGEIYSFKGNNSLSRDKLNYENGSVKNIHYGDIHTKFATHFDITKELVPFINASEVGVIRSENLCTEGDMIFADASEDMADIGKSIEIIELNGERVVSGLHTILARQQINQIALGFGGHLFKSTWVRTQIQKEAQGAKVLGISPTRMRYIRLPIPPTLAEQQRIADCLSSLDALIAAQARKVDALKSHKKGLMQQLFPRDGETQPRLRFPEFQDAGEWEQKTIGSVCSSFSGGTPNTSIPEYYGGEIPFIRSAEIARDRTELFLTRDGLLNSAAKPISKGDVLIALYGANSGDVALAKLDGAINQAILCLKSQGSNAFIYHFMTFKKDWVVATYLQGGQGNLSGEIVKSILTRFPTLAEQQRIADCLSSLDDLITAATHQLATLKTHKQGLMQQLFPNVEEIES